MAWGSVIRTYFRYSMIDARIYGSGIGSTSIADYNPKYCSGFSILIMIYPSLKKVSVWSMDASVFLANCIDWISVFPRVRRRHWSGWDHRLTYYGSCMRRELPWTIVLIVHPAELKISIGHVHVLISVTKKMIAMQFSTSCLGLVLHCWEYFHNIIRKYKMFGTLKLTSLIQLILNSPNSTVI